MPSGWTAEPRGGHGQGRSASVGLVLGQGLGVCRRDGPRFGVVLDGGEGSDQDMHW